MILRKDNTVSLAGLHIKMRRVLGAVEEVYRLYGRETVITAGTEIWNGNKLIHSATSFHPFGRALDFRIFYFTIGNTADIDYVLVEEIAQELRKKLGKNYDVIVHKNHIHIEYDPKRILIRN